MPGFIGKFHQFGRRSDELPFLANTDDQFGQNSVKKYICGQIEGHE